MNQINYILVLGGSGGIGSALCQKLFVADYTPIICYNKNKEIAENIANETGGLALNLNLKNEKSIEKALIVLGNFLNENKILKGIVLTSSPPPEIVSFEALKSKSLKHQFMVNVIGPRLLISSLIKNYFKKNKSGFVIGVLSKAIGSQELLPSTGMDAYVIGKIAMEGMLRLCKAQFSWLKVETISPGYTDTNMLKVFDPRFLELIKNKERFSSANEVADLIIQKIKNV